MSSSNGKDGPPTGAGAINDVEDGPRVHHGPSGTSSDGIPRTANSEDLAGPKNGEKKGDNGGAKGGSKGGEKKGLKPCVGSKFTTASLRQTMDDSIGLAVVRKNLWTRVLTELLTWRDAQRGLSEGARSDQSECIDAFEASVRSAKTAAEKVKSAAENARRQLAISCAPTYGVSMSRPYCALGRPFRRHGPQ